MVKVLLVEDDKLIGQGVKLNLQLKNYQVEWVQDGANALASLKLLEPDLVILDLNLPNVSGMEILRLARSQGIKTPILILTARDAIEDRVTGLDKGADDYLVKPFSIDELDSRLKALHRRFHGRSEEIINFQEIKINTQARQVFFKGDCIETSRREYDLLALFLDNVGRVLSRRQIEASLYEDDVESNALEVHIHNLRKKLGKKLITTVRGVGYFVKE
ncbi:MAG: response regulator transcription factor [Oceanospirillaceae bacterium]